MRETGAVTEATTRSEQKERTRDALLAAALKLSQTDGFGQVSLRNVTREAGVVPTTFYRHFTSMDELGLTLVEQSFATLRRMMRDAQRDPNLFPNLVHSSTDIVVEAVKANREHFAFVARERTGGSEAVRDAIQRELELFISELAVSISRVPELAQWSTEDVMMLSGIFVREMVYRTERILALPDGRPDLEEELKAKTRAELRMIILGVANWKSR
jgi:AcrR family transcriptional regulator